MWHRQAQLASDCVINPTFLRNPEKPRKLNNPSINRTPTPNRKSKIINYIRAGYPGLYLVSPEEQRVDAEIKQIARDLNYSLHIWSCVDGLVDTKKHTTTAANDPLQALVAIKEMSEKTVILLRDFHLFLQDPNPILIHLSQLQPIFGRFDPEGMFQWNSATTFPSEAVVEPSCRFSGVREDGAGSWPAQKTDRTS